MKGIICSRGKILVEDIPRPICTEGEVLVKNISSLISIGTEKASISIRSKSMLEIARDRPDLLEKAKKILKQEGLLRTYKLAKEHLNEPTLLGYSCAGVILDVGKNVADFKVGDRVACGGNTANHAEYVAVPSNLCAKIPDPVSFDEAAFTALGAIALQGIRRADVRLGEKIAVIGLGLIGLLTVQLAKAAGAFVLGLDIDPNKIEIALKNGCDKAFLSTNENLNAIARDFTNGVGFDSVIITASANNNGPILTSLDLIRKKGRIVLVGAVDIKFPREQFYKKEGDFLISTSYGPGRYDDIYEKQGLDYPIAYVRWTEKRNMECFLTMIAEKKISIKQLISKRFPIENALEAYNSMNRPEITGLIITYDTEKTETTTTLKTATGSIPLAKDKINLAFIGAGNFLKGYHLPILAKMDKVRIYAIISTNPANASNLAKKYNAQYCGTDYHAVIDDPNVDAVYITTRHDTHARIATDALKKNKHVFVEKPAALNKTELDEVVNAAKASKGILFIGFNRRFSPYILKCKEILKTTEGPLFINYHVNAGHLDINHWLNNPTVGGGRLIGEGVHFIDLIHYLCDSDVEDFSVSSIDTSKENFTATLKYKSGSIGVIIYSTNGAPSMQKEKIIISKGGISLELNDFKELKIFKNSMTSYKYKLQNKGYHEENMAFIDSLATGQSPILLAELYDVHDIAFRLNNAILNN